MASYVHRNKACFRMADLAERSSHSAQGPYLQRTRIVNIRKKTRGDCLNMHDSEICSKGGNFFKKKSTCSANHTEALVSNSFKRALHAPDTIVDYVPK